MVKKILIYCICLFSGTACSLKQDLDLRSVGNSRGYFMSCQCTPEDLYRLLIYRFEPLTQGIRLDSTLDCQITITDTRPVTLHHRYSLSVDSIYNFRSNEVCHTPASKELLLDILTPEGERITARATVPDPVKIDSVPHRSDGYHCYFTSSVDTAQNYYIGNVRYYDSKLDSVVINDKFFIRTPANQPYAINYTRLPKHYDRVTFLLFRMSREGFYLYQNITEAWLSSTDKISPPIEFKGNVTGGIGMFCAFQCDTVVLNTK